MAFDELASPDPFEQIAKTSPVGLGEDQSSANADDPFAQIAQSGGVDPSSVAGAFSRGVARNIVPAAGGIVGMGAGAEAGAAAGVPLAPFTLGWSVPIGGVIGAITGAYLGSTALSTAQNYALSKAPDSWKEKIGLDERQEQLDEASHPYASFLGGLAPYALTMRPTGLGKAAALPENATSLQRILANPVTARVFGGAAMGAMELGNEAASDENLDWRKAALATGFGIVFNKPTRLGEAITELGARPARRIFGRPEPTAGAAPPAAAEAPAAQPEAEAQPTAPVAPTTAREWNETILGQGAPTIAEAGDLGVAGPGLTEETFQGGEQPAESAARAAQDAARTERLAIEGPPKPDPVTMARRMQPELFAEYDALASQQAEFRRWIDEYNAPPPDVYRDMENRRRALETQLAEHVAGQGGYTGGKQARQLRAQIRDIEAEQREVSERAVAYFSGKAEETADLAMARQHLMATEFKLRDLLPQVQAAYRRAAEATHGETFAPPARAEAQPAPPAPVAEAAAPAAPAEAPATPAIETAMAPAAPEAAAVAPPVQPAETPKIAAEPAAAAQVAPPAAPTAKPIEAQRDFIRKDVTEQLIAAGRPKEEAEAAGALEAAYYEARAARFNGALGTPEELYTREGSRIFARGQRIPSMRPRLPRVVNPEKLSLLQFLAWRGGISADDHLVADLRSSIGERNKFIPGFGALIRKGGMSLDRAREAAVEAGYLHEAGTAGGVAQSSINDLLDAADRELRGDKVYRIGQEPPPESRLGPEPPEGAEAPEYAPKPPPVSPLMSAADYATLWQHKQEGVPLFEQTQAGPQGVIPGAERAGQGEMAQRAANAPLKPSKEQKPMDIGLFGDEKDQGSLFQGTHGGIVLNPEGIAGRDWVGIADTPAIIRLAEDANASTFIHESGHKYLADLLRDAEHPQAPQELKDDAATTLNWLGIDKAENLTRRAHEKFARGFEQYLREGVAPSQRLASVFAKFRDWLLNVYQTLKGLGKPINDDIRGVFDRLLATQEERTVIAPEREERPTLADIHEADAALVAPSDADAAMAQVYSERQRAYDEHPDEQRELESELAAYYAEHPPEIEPPAEGGPGPGGLSEVQPGGEPAQPVPPGGATGAQPRPQRPGGNAPRAEGAGVPGAAERGREQPGPDANPLAANPAFTFDRPESPAVDKAGNIRVENITSLPGLVQAIHESAERNDEFRSVRGPMTAGQILDLANDLGLSASTVSEQRLAEIYGSIDGLASKALALRKLLRDSAGLVHAAMQKAAESGDDRDAIAMAQAAARHDMIQGTVAKVTAEIGRGLGMGFKNLEGWQQIQDIGEFAKQATGKELWQLKAMAKLGAKLDSPDKISKFLRNAQRRSFPGMLLEFWINGLISGIATHVTYTVGNGLLNAERMLLTAPVAAALGRLREAGGEAGEHVQMGEVGARARGLVRGLPATMQATLEALRSGVTVQLPGETSRAMMPFAGDRNLVVGKSMTNEPVTWGEVSGDLAGAVRGMRDAIRATAEAVSAGGEAGAPLIGPSYSPLGQIPDIAYRGVPVLPFGSAVRLPSRMIATIHTFFGAATFSMEKAAIAYRRAAAEGLEGHAFEARVADIYEHPDDATMARAAGVAREYELMGAGGQFTQALTRLTNVEISGFKPLKFIDPFVHIASNVIDQSIVRRTPIGLLSPELRADLAGRIDPVTGKVDVAARDMAQARMLVGTALAATFAGLAAEGYISGSGPRDPKEAAMWRLAGNQAHSVRVGDTWYDVHRLGPLGMLLGIAADMYDVAHMASQQDMITAAAHLQHAVVQNILDESFMRGPASLIQAVEDPQRYGQQYIENFLASFVPFSVGLAQMSRAADPYSRQARSVMDSIKRNIPGLSETLYPRRDIWGEPIPNLPAFGGRGLTAFYEQKIKNDPVDHAMIELGIAPAQPQRKVRNVELTDGQYDDFTRLAGRMAKLRLDAIVRSPDFQMWPANLRVNIVNEVIRQSRGTAREMMMMKYPQIMADSVNAQKQRLTGTDPAAVRRRLEMNR